MGEQLSLIEEQAFQLSRCALSLDSAREHRKADPTSLVAALNANLELWIAIRSTMTHDDCSLSADTKANLTRLAEFVAGKTFEGIDTLSDEAIKGMVNINLQISEGLLEGARK